MIGSALGRNFMQTKTEVFARAFFKKLVGFKRAKPFDALRRVRKLELNLFNLYRQAHFRGFGPLLQVKRGTKTTDLLCLSSKIIRGMIFDGWNLL